MTQTRFSNPAFKAGLEEHKGECEDRVQQVTGLVNKEKGQVAEKTAIGAPGPVDISLVTTWSV